MTSIGSLHLHICLIICLVSRVIYSFIMILLCAYFCVFVVCSFLFSVNCVGAGMSFSYSVSLCSVQCALLGLFVSR